MVGQRSRICTADSVESRSLPNGASYGRNSQQKATSGAEGLTQKLITSHPDFVRDLARAAAS